MRFCKHGFAAVYLNAEKQPQGDWCAMLENLIGVRRSQGISKMSASPNKIFLQRSSMQGWRGLGTQELVRLLWQQLFVTTDNRTGKSFFGPKAGIMCFRMLCSWHRWWGIPVESNIPQVGLALLTLMKSLLWHGAHFFWQALATSPAQLFLSSLNAVIAKSIFLNNWSWHLQVWGEMKVTASLSWQNTPKIFYLCLSQPLARWHPCWEGRETSIQVKNW